MAKRVLAFDFGASSGRAMLGEYDGKSITVTEIHRFSNDPVILHGTMYWDTLRLFHEVKQGILKALALGPVDSIGIDTWGVDFGMIDKNGDLIANPVNYRDERTNGMPEEVAALVPMSELYRRTGTQTMRINTLYQLYYLAHYRPELMARCEKILFTPDLFAYYLTGEMRAEETIASTSNFQNPYTKAFDTELLETLGIPSRILPPVIHPGEVYGTLTEALSKELGCGRIPVTAVCTHDTASAYLSAPTEGDMVCISCGTWSLFGTELASPVITEESERIQYTNEGGHSGTTRFLKNIMGLWLIQESRRQWKKEGFDYSFADLERMALEAEPYRCFIDCDAPEFAIAGDLPGRVRDFCRRTGQYVPETVGEVMRCLYQSLAMKYKISLEALEGVSGKVFPSIHMLGGGIKDTLLCRMTADATGRTVLAGPIEATVMGNIATQLIALGEIADVKAARAIIKASTPLAIYEPAEREAFEAHYGAFKAILGK